MKIILFVVKSSTPLFYIFDILDGMYCTFCSRSTNHEATSDVVNEYANKGTLMPILTAQYKMNSLHTDMLYARKFMSLTGMNENLLEQVKQVRIIHRALGHLGEPALCEHINACNRHSRLF